MERKPKVLRELRVYAREKAPFEAEFPLVRENLIEDKFNPENIDQDDPDQDDPDQDDPTELYVARNNNPDQDDPEP